MEHKIMSQDCLDDCFESVHACIKDMVGDFETCDSCSLNKCNFSCVDTFPLAMAYIPMQKFENLYSVEEALCSGTLFKDLDKPFYGGKLNRKECSK